MQLSVAGENNYVRLAWRKSGGSPTFRVASGISASTTLTIPNLEQGTLYEIRAYLMHRQSFDLYRAGNTGAAGTLIAEGNPAAKWAMNLTGNGLGKNTTVSATTLAQQTGGSVSISPATVTVAEGDTATVTVTLDTTFDADKIIPLSVGGTAGSGDYSGVPTSVTIDANTRTQTFTVNAVADALADTGETVIIGIDSDHATFPDDLAVGTPDTSTITITDDPTVRITPVTATVAEGGTVTVTLTLSATFSADVLIPLSVGGTAGSGDYSGVPGGVTIDANTRTQTFTVNAVADSVADSGETVIISIGTPPSGISKGTPDTTTITITDVTVSYDPSSYTVSEGGSTTVTIKLTAAPGTSVTVPLTHRGTNGATSGDYTVPNPFRVTFGATDTEATFTFGATDDTDDDDDETVNLGFGTLPPGVNAGATATVTINDNDDPQVTVFYDPTTYTVTEGGATTVTVKLSAPPERQVVIPLTHTPAGTTTGSDYTVPDPFQVTFGATDTTRTFTFVAATDADTDDETVDLGFGTLPPDVNAGATATVTINDSNDPTITVFYDPTTYTVTEGSSTTVTVKLSAAPGTSVTVPLTHRGSNGATGGDYTVPAPFRVTFGATDTEATFTFGATDDTDDDDDETVDLGFGTLPPGVNAGATATVTINDNDDPQVTVFYDPTTYTVTEGGATTVIIKLSAPPERQLTVPLTHRGSNGATSGDYTVPNPFRVTFGATDTEATFTFGATDDTDDDGETVDLGFGTLPPDVNAGATATITISDAVTPPVTPLVTPPRPSEPPPATTQPPTVTVSYGSPTYTVREGSTVAVTIILSAAPTTPTAIVTTDTPGRGTTADDYSDVPPTATFEATQTTRSFPFSATEDTEADDGETVTLGFATLPPSVTLGTYPTAVVTILDSQPPETIDEPAEDMQEIPSVIVTPTLLTFPEGSGDTYTVVLTLRPTGTVTVTPSVSGDDDVTVDRPWLTFTAGDWHIPQTVTVRGARDGDTTNDTAQIKHTVSGANYESETADDVAITVTDGGRLGPPPEFPTG